MCLWGPQLLSGLQLLCGAMGKVNNVNVCKGFNVNVMKTLQCAMLKKKSEKATDAINVVIQNIALNRSNVRKIGCSIKCYESNEYAACVNKNKPRNHADHFHCKFCVKIFKSPEYVYKHYSRKHSNHIELQGIFCELIA